MAMAETFYFRAGATAYFGHTKNPVIHHSVLIPYFMAESTPTAALLHSSTLISQGAEAVSGVQSTCESG